MSEQVIFILVNAVSNAFAFAVGMWWGARRVRKAYEQALKELRDQHL